MRWIELRETGTQAAPRDVAEKFAVRLRQRLNTYCEITLTQPNNDGTYFVGFTDESVAMAFAAACARYGKHYVVHDLQPSTPSRARTPIDPVGDILRRWG